MTYCYNQDFFSMHRMHNPKSIWPQEQRNWQNSQTLQNKNNRNDDLKEIRFLFSVESQHKHKMCSRNNTKICLDMINIICVLLYIFHRLLCSLTQPFLDCKKIFNLFLYLLSQHLILNAVQFSLFYSWTHVVPSSVIYNSY